MSTTTEQIVYEVRNPGYGELYRQEVGMKVARQFIDLIGTAATSGWSEQIRATFDEQDGEDFLAFDGKFVFPTGGELLFGLLVYEGADRAQAKVNGSTSIHKEIPIETGRLYLIHSISIALLKAALIAKEWYSAQMDQGVFGKKHEIYLGDLQRRLNTALKSVQ